jgi:hypothetical protein
MGCCLRPYEKLSDGTLAPIAAGTIFRAVSTTTGIAKGWIQVVDHVPVQYFDFKEIVWRIKV